MKKIFDFILRQIRHLVAACRYSLAGVAASAKTETAFRQELLLGVVHFVAMWLLQVSALQALILSALWCGILVVELLNTAIEAVVDLSAPDYHDLAKKAKDAASAAVALVLIAYLASWGVVLFVNK